MPDRLVERDSAAADFGQNGLCGGGPNEGFGLVVVDLHVLLDSGDQVRYGVEGPSSDGLVGQLAEPSLDQVQPGRGGRGEVQVEPGCLASQIFTFLCLWVA